MNLLIFLLFFQSYSFDVTNFQIEETDIEVVVNNIRSPKGIIRIAVYDRPEVFNDEHLVKHSFSKEQLVNGELSCKFSLPPGTYAFSLLDDENGDWEMNYNIIRMPKEGFGFSRDAPIKMMKIPGFEDCQIQVGTTKASFRIKIRYM